MQKSAFFLIASSIAGLLSTNALADESTAIFAGGCFWCMEKDFEHVPGVISAESGYTGGSTNNPTYKNYESGNHIEAIRIKYNPAEVTYDQLLYTFWRSVNPTDAGGQFCDRGIAYSTAIYPVNEEQKAKALASKQALVADNPLPKPIVTPIISATQFWPAEDYHQDYYKKSSIRYGFYRKSCGRDRTIQSLWGKEAHSGIVY